MKRLDLLDVWQSIHGIVLTASLRQQFVRSEEARLICTYEDEHILAALKRSPKLAVVLSILRDEQGGPLGGDLPAPRPQPDFGVYEKPRARRARSDRNGSESTAWQPPAPYGTTDPRYK